MKKLGFIGLGNQGAAIAGRMLAAGYELVLWARRPQTFEPFAETSAQFASSIAELGEQVDLASICVVDDAGVQQVCDALMPTMRPGSSIVIHSTVHPKLCQALAQEAAGYELQLIDAPVSGGGETAAAGTLTVMVGGDAQVVAAIKPVLETFAGEIVHLGEVGAGQNAKLVNNALLAANVAVAHYALEAAQSLGIDSDAFAELVKVSSGRSFGFEVRTRMQALSAFGHGASLLVKDVQLLGDTLGDDPSYAPIRDVAMPFLELVLKP